MKILFISDIHGYTQNLKLLEKCEYDHLVFLGDLFYCGYENEDIFNNKAVEDFLNANRDKIICIKGNCDSEYDYIKLNMPFSESYVKITDGCLDIYCTHGHLYNYRNLSYLGSPGVIIYGHEHVPYIKRFNDTTYICVGSISRPRYGSAASYCLYEKRTFTLYSVHGEILDKVTI